MIEDDEAEIMEAVRRMSDRYDFVVTRHASRRQVQSKCFDLLTVRAEVVGSVQRTDTTFFPPKSCHAELSFKTRRHHLLVDREGIRPQACPLPGRVRTHETSFRAASLPAKLRLGRGHAGQAG